MENNKTFIIAEISANHNHDFDLTVKTIKAIAETGAILWHSMLTMNISVPKRKVYGKE